MPREVIKAMAWVTLGAPAALAGAALIGAGAIYLARHKPAQTAAAIRP